MDNINTILEELRPSQADLYSIIEVEKNIIGLFLWSSL